MGKGKLFVILVGNGGGLIVVNFFFEVVNFSLERVVFILFLLLLVVVDCVVKRVIRWVLFRGEFEVGVMFLFWMIEVVGVVDVVDEGWSGIVLLGGKLICGDVGGVFG